MKIEELLAQSYHESHEAQIKELILCAFKEGYTEGYNRGLKKSHEIIIDSVKYIDLGLPSGTLWSNPIDIAPPGCNYRNYKMCSYNEVCELALPTPEDVEELLHHCMLSFHDNPSKAVYVTAPNGQRIVIETKNYLNRPENPHSHLRMRKGETPAGTNMFWLKSEVKDNEARVGVVDTNDKTLYTSTHFTGFKLPYVLVKK
jgi:hypothetical protein